MTKQTNDIFSVENAYESYSDMLYRIALTQLEHPTDAEDAVHDVFVKYYHHRNNFKDVEHQKAWLIRVTVNQCYDMLRKRKVRQYEELDQAKGVAMPVNDQPEILSYLDQLEIKYRTVIVLHYLEDLSVEEISRTLKISKSAVKMRLSRGREMLKGILIKEDEYV